MQGILQIRDFIVSDNKLKQEIPLLEEKVKLITNKIKVLKNNNLSIIDIYSKCKNDFSDLIDFLSKGKIHVKDLSIKSKSIFSDLILRKGNYGLNTAIIDFYAIFDEIIENIINLEQNSNIEVSEFQKIDFQRIPIEIRIINNNFIEITTYIIYLLLISELHIDNDIIFDENELIENIHQSTIEFAVLAKMLNVWEPKENSNFPQIKKVKEIFDNQNQLMKDIIVFDWDKARSINSILYILKSLVEFKLDDIYSIIYCADVYSLTNYARPITGDFYISKNKLPFPYFIRNFMELALKSQNEFLKIEGNSFYPSTEIDFDEFSKSDLNSLDYAINIYINNQLNKFISEDKALKTNTPNKAITVNHILMTNDANSAFIKYAKESVISFRSEINFSNAST
jgi:hypothetical protein